VTEIGFYHLTRTKVEAALPQLLGRTLAAGQRALVLCPTTDRVAALDAALWECTERDWLPHGTPADGDADLQPVWIDVDDAAPNGARFLFLIDGSESTRLAEYERVFDLFDGNDQAVLAAARIRWQAARQSGFTVTYWRQTARGWEKQA
jgi:DNA polymerase III subunit chi